MNKDEINQMILDIMEVRELTEVAVETIKTILAVAPGGLVTLPCTMLETMVALIEGQGRIVDLVVNGAIEMVDGAYDN